ncbi:hypothetical protein CRG98_026463, partial [Punica granatum]
MVTCSPDGLVISLGTPSQSLSGSLSPSVGNLTNLQSLLLQDNDISGLIPPELGRLSKLRTLDISTNSFTGKIPTELSDLRSLQYLRINNNSLSGEIPPSLANMSQLVVLDLSYNNLSGPVPSLRAHTINIAGNQLICADGAKEECKGTTLMPFSFSLNNSQTSRPSSRSKTRKIALAFGTTLSCICVIALTFSFIIWWRRQHNKQIFFDVNERHYEDISLGNLRKFHFRELQAATGNFSSKNLIGKGGSGN